MNIHNRVKQILSNKDCTIQKICKLVEVNDEFKIISIIGDLESSGEICLKGFDKFYEPDGSPGFLAKYGLDLIRDGNFCSLRKNK